MQMSSKADSRLEARNARVEAWLATGGVVLAASERAARSVAAEFHAARQREGRRAWVTPAILSWEGWVREQWLERNTAGLMPLNPLQERALWKRAIGRSRAAEGLLHLRRLAVSAQHAYRLLCQYAPEWLRAAARRSWSGDAAIFSEWVDEFEVLCRREEAISTSRLLPDLTAKLAGIPDQISRPPLLLIGFDRLLPAQEGLLKVWGRWDSEAAVEAAGSTRFLAAGDAKAELDACVGWLRGRLTADPKVRLMVVTTQLRERRGELERALLSGENGRGLDFEFSLGVPLSKVSVARSAVLLLRWLAEPIREPELDWLLGSGHCAASSEEELELQEAMRELRRLGKERPEWRIEDLAGAFEGLERRAMSTGAQSGLRPWRARMVPARQRLAATAARLSPLEWASTARQLLESMGWPGFRPETSVVYQARERFDKVLEDCASLGFDGSRMEWAEFAAAVGEAASETIFAPESGRARVLITEPLESAGQLADGIWFMGADEESWPAAGQPHPLLPIGLQRDAGMPHAGPRTDWELAQQVTSRLLASAGEVVFSYARQSAEAELQPSRIVTQQAGPADELIEADGGGRRDFADRTESVADAPLIPFPLGEIRGGAGTLTRQSLCPFQAFAVTRLGAKDWQPAEPGLTPSQRGLLLHAVMHRIWGGAAQGGISTLDELTALPDLRRFAGRIVAEVMREAFDQTRRNAFPDRYPARYLALETERLTRLATEWLEYERQRLPFLVAGTEIQEEVTIAGRALKLRLDRIDTLPDGSRLIVDYKSNAIGPSAWKDARPEDVQLPLYASFAITEELEGLVFARVMPGKMQFCGRVRDARKSLLPGLGGQNGLVKDPLTDNQLMDWRRRIQRLGEQFIAGRAEVDPKDPKMTCARCHLHAVCRIYENQPESVLLSDADEFGGDGGGADAES